MIQADKYKAEALRKKNSLLKMVLNQIDAFICVKDSKGRYKYVNQNYHELFNLPEKEWMERTDVEFLDQDSVQKIRRHEQEVLLKGEPASFEEVIPIEGRDRLFISYKVPLTDASEYGDWVCNFATEITGFKNEIPVFEGYEE